MASSGSVAAALGVPNTFTALVTLAGGVVTTSVVKALATKTAAYAVGASDEVILCNTTAAAFAITLPTAVGASGRIITVKKIDSSANALTIASVAGLIEGAATLVVSIANTSYDFISNGTDWLILSQKVAVLI